MIREVKRFIASCDTHGCTATAECAMDKAPRWSLPDGWDYVPGYPREYGYGSPRLLCPVCLVIHKEERERDNG